MNLHGQYDWCWKSHTVVPMRYFQKEFIEEGDTHPEGLVLSHALKKRRKRADRQHSLLSAYRLRVACDQAPHSPATVTSSL